MGKAEKLHEATCKRLFATYFCKLASEQTDDPDLKKIIERIDALGKIEDFVMKWRGANHAKFLVWGPISISLVLAVAGMGAGLQAYATFRLEKKKVQADIVLKVARDNSEETRVNLEALKQAGLLDLKSEEIGQLCKLRPPTKKEKDSQ